MNTQDDSAGVIAPPPLIYAGSLALGLLLNWLRPLGWLPRSVARPLGLLLIALSWLPGTLAVREMRQVSTNVSPYQPVKAIVSGGPYRYTRNPIYLSMTLLYTGVAVLTNALWPMLLLPVVQIVMRRGVIDREERYLERKFGTEYTDYKARVRRWV